MWSTVLLGIIAGIGTTLFSLLLLFVLAGWVFLAGESLHFWSVADFTIWLFFIVVGSLIIGIIGGVTSGVYQVRDC